MLDRTLAPLASAPYQTTIIPEAKSYKLENGIPVHLLLSGVHPIVRVEFIFEAGTWYENKDNAAYCCTKMLSSGTHKHTAEQIEDKIAFYGAFLDLESSADRSVLTLYCLSKHLGSLLPLIQEMFFSSSFPEREFDNLKTITLQNLKVNQTKTSHLASVCFKESLFGGAHPYGKSLREDALHRLTVNDVRAFYNYRFSYKTCNIVLSGNGNQDFIHLLNDHFGNSLWGAARHEKFSYLPQPAVKYQLVKKENNLQSSIKVGRELFTINHEDYLLTYITVEILGGYFGSRLMKNIREEKGFTYGIHAHLINHYNTGYLSVSTDVNKENTEETLVEIYKEMSILRQSPVSESELDNVKNYMLGSFYNSINTPFSLADKFKTIYFNNLDYSFYQKYIETIQQVKAEDIMSMANRYLNRETMSVVVAGGA